MALGGAWNDGTESGRVPLLVDGHPDTPLIIRLKDGGYCVHG